MTKKATKKAEETEIKDEEVVEKDEVKEEDKKPSSKKTGMNKEESAKETDEIKDKPSEGEQKEHEKLTGEVEGLKQQVAEALESATDWNNKYLRLSAEFDNYRKRTLKEKVELTKQANADLLKDMLSVIDDFERGMDNIAKSEDIESLKTGVELIYTKFIEFTRQNGIKEIEAREKDFDLDYHEAITKIPAPSEDLKGKVVDVVEKGYLLNEKVLRYSKVVVGE